ncbi:MAG: hydantoinase B/oxoprolinase family protein [Deltaproteobacteria bacterium]|nr:hydantoinase B/oxoprolinase family protein [Candidatus Anaeroferrophillacea bacterium]
MSKAISPILLQVFKNRFAAIAEEMGTALVRTAFSPNIKERRDCSCAVFDRDGDMIAQAAHIPVHLGSMPLSVQAAIAEMPMAPGDMVILNDPFSGGTHLPDVTLVAPVFCGADTERPAFYVANRAHHADIGGMTAGSMPLSTSLFQEGLIIPPLKIRRGGKTDDQLMRFLLANVRTPAEREGDFAAQVNANLTGIRRMEEMATAVGADTAERYAAALQDYTEQLVRARLAAIPDGTWSFTDFLDGDGIDRDDIAIRLILKIAGDTARLDFTASDDQVTGSVNAVRAITLSAVLYVFRCLITDDIPANAGCLRPLTVTTRPGSVVDAIFPAAVAAGNVETSQRIVDVILGALATALPDEIPAASQGTMNNLTIGGFDPRRGRPFAYYETLAGGTGGSPTGPGEAAIHSHMTNTLNTPVEALEYSYPFRVREYAIRRGSGGAGRHFGGDGLVREIELLAEAETTVLAERRRHAPYGLADGAPGAPGRNIVVRSKEADSGMGNGTGNGGEEVLPGKFSRRLRAGDILRIETPGGGGYGALDNL